VQPKKIKIVLFLLSVLTAKLFSQDSDPAKAWGGVTDIFDYPVGARAMAMGGAYVAAVDDPFALYWNPAALQQVSNMGLGLYYTNLAGSSSYQYIAYAHPTLFTGTFSAGILSISTGGVDIRDDDPALVGTTNFGRTLFLFGYGFNVRSGISLGVNFKVERANLIGYDDDPTTTYANLTESSYGADFGLLIAPKIKGYFLNDITVGICVQNVLQRTIRAMEARETTPINVRFGLAKNINFSGQDNQIVMAFEVDKNEMTPLQPHLGLEYCYMQLASLRVGMSADKLTFGAGAKIAGMNLDYSYWNGNNALLGANHRISVVLNVGKNRQQRLEEYHQRELQRIEQIEAARLETERKNAISTGLSDGERFLAKNDLDQAYVTVNKLLVRYDKTGSDPDLEVARDLHSRISKELDEKRAQEEADLRRLQEEEALIRRNAKAAEDHYKRYLALYTEEEYHDAILEIDKALEYNPNSEQYKKLRSDAETALAAKINSLMERANTLEASGRSNEAITQLNEAKRLARDNERTKSYIVGRIDQISAGLSRDSLLRQAMQYENDKNWNKAAELYKDLSNAQPGNAALRKKYEDAYSRANAKDLPMPANVQAYFNRSLAAARAGNYQDALRFLEEARKIQPLNSNILRAIDSVNEKIKRANAPAGK
jgi:tetratricopeptide (TPR) repeat protein